MSLEPGLDSTQLMDKIDVQMINQIKLEIVIDEFLESYVPPNNSVYVILQFQNRNLMTRIFKDRARKL